MPIYGAKYTQSWTDVFGDRWGITLKKRGYAGAAQELEAAGNPMADKPVGISYSGGRGQDRAGGGVYGSACEVFVLTSERLRMEEFMSPNPGTWLGEITLNGLPYWSGLLQSDLGEESLRTREFLTLTLTDGLGDAREKPLLTPEGKQYYDPATARDWLVRCLQATGLSLSLWVADGLLPDGLVIPAPEGLSSVNLDIRAFGPQPPKIGDVLTELCQLHGAALFQAGGAWHFRRPNPGGEGLVKSIVYEPGSALGLYIQQDMTRPIWWSGVGLSRQQQDENALLTFDFRKRYSQPVRRVVARFPLEYPVNGLESPRFDRVNPAAPLPQPVPGWVVRGGALFQLLDENTRQGGKRVRLTGRYQTAPNAGVVSNFASTAPTPILGDYEPGNFGVPLVPGRRAKITVEFLGSTACDKATIRVMASRINRNNAPGAPDFKLVYLDEAGVWQARDTVIQPELRFRKALDGTRTPEWTTWELITDPLPVTATLSAQIYVYVEVKYGNSAGNYNPGAEWVEYRRAEIVDAEPLPYKAQVVEVYTDAGAKAEELTVRFTDGTPAAGVTGYYGVMTRQDLPPVVVIPGAPQYPSAPPVTIGWSEDGGVRGSALYCAALSVLTENFTPRLLLSGTLRNRAVQMGEEYTWDGRRLRLVQSDHDLRSGHARVLLAEVPGGFPRHMVRTYFEDSNGNPVGETTTEVGGTVEDTGAALRILAVVQNGTVSQKLPPDFETLKGQKSGHGKIMSNLRVPFGKMTITWLDLAPAPPYTLSVRRVDTGLEVVNAEQPGLERYFEAPAGDYVATVTNVAGDKDTRRFTIHGEDLEISSDTAACDGETLLGTLEITHRPLPVAAYHVRVWSLLTGQTLVSLRDVAPLALSFVGRLVAYTFQGQLRPQTCGIEVQNVVTGAKATITRELEGCVVIPRQYKPTQYTVKQFQ